MGRTLTPYSQEYAAFQQRAQKFRRALRTEDQAILDEILELGRLNNQSGVYAAAPLPLESFLLAILVEYKKTINHLERQLLQMREQLRMPALAAPRPSLADDTQPRLHFPTDEGSSGDEHATD